MEKKYGPKISKLRHPDETDKKKTLKRREKDLDRENLFKAKAAERKLKNIDYEIKDLVAQYDAIDAKSINEFKDFPISVKTLQGLLDADFTKPTDIQRQSIGLALQGCDILGAAKTGSGKTLAFLIPILECLYRQKWSNLDGMGALIISPVRELAYQTFEVLRKIGRKHDFSAGLVIGGKRLEEECARIHRTNIVICTPGRLLQHMDQTAYFDANSLQILVLDEADRILDLGFAPTMNAIIQNLPPERQTLLFSATQTKSVKDLARLSLNKPMYISAHELARHTTPTQLQQHYMVCELHDKFNVLWSFVANHLKSKIIVFIATSKQVKYMAESFSRLRCGLTIHSLYGSMDQIRRVGTYESFCRKEHALLLATDVAARGLDFPAVDWVVQLDCPEDTNTYIHRVGRTARYEENGQALLILLPSEVSMVTQLRDKKIPIDEIKPNPKRIWSQQARLDSFTAADPLLKAKAQAAFTTYLKCVYLMGDKSVFNYHALNTEAYASSMGLAIAPRVRFIEAALRKQKHNSQKLESDVTDKSRKGKNIPENNDGGTDKSQKRINKVEIHDTDKISKHKNLPKKDDVTGKTVKQKILIENDEITDKKTKHKNVDLESPDVTDEEKDQENSDESETEESDTEQGLEKDENATSLRFEVNEDEDLFSVKKSERTVDSESEEEDPEEPKNQMSNTKKGKKAVTRVAVAKKLLKRDLQVNKKTTFDAEGKIVRDPHKDASKAPTKSHGTGLDIAEAKKFMETEDKMDREVYRLKIKKKHREEKLKAKEERRQANRHRNQQNNEDSEEDVVVTLGGGGEENSDDMSASDSGSEESWREPNPSKRSRDTGSPQRSRSPEESESDESSSEDEPPPRRPIRKKQKTSQEDDEDFSTKLSVKDAEDLALKLLT